MRIAGHVSKTGASESTSSARDFVARLFIPFRFFFRAPFLLLLIIFPFIRAKILFVLPFPPAPPPRSPPFLALVFVLVSVFFLLSSQQKCFFRAQSDRTDQGIRSTYTRSTCAQTVMFVVSDGDGADVADEVDYAQLADLAGIGMINASEQVSEMCKEQVS